MSYPAKIFSVPSVDEMQSLIKFCEVLAKAPFYAKMGPAGVLAVYLTAKEMNLPLMACLNGGLYTFDGKVTMSAQLMNMMIVNAGHKANVLKLDESICEIEFVRGDRKGNDSKFVYSFSIQNAEKAGYLKKDNWRNHPRDMLFSRTLSGGARKFMPDVLMNAYVFGEIEDENIPTVAVEKEEVWITHQIPEAKVEEKTEGFDKFLLENNIVENSEAFNYVQHVVDSSNYSFIQVINGSIKNHQRFLTGLNKWREEKNQAVATQ